jgi:hypothetical protein
VKERIKAATKAHFLRGAFYLLLLLAVYIIPFAHAQQNSPQVSEQSMSGNKAQLPITSSDRDASALPMPEFPTGGPLYDQYNNPATEPPLGIGSQKFEPAMAAFNDQAADDFVVNVPPLSS